MIKINIYDDGVLINGHANHEICYQVSIAIYILANAVGYIGHRLHHELENGSGVSKLKFNLTDETTLLRDSYEKDMRAWFNEFYINDVKVDRIYENVEV